VEKEVTTKRKGNSQPVGGNAYFRLTGKPDILDKTIENLMIFNGFVL